MLIFQNNNSSGNFFKPPSCSSKCIVTAPDSLDCTGQVFHREAELELQKIQPKRLKNYSGFV